MSEEVEREIPERVYLKACHPASPSRNCTWSISQTPQDSVEYIRAQPPTADAETVALELVRSLYNINCFECSDVFCAHWQSSAASIIFDTLSAAKQQGRDEQREKDAQLAEHWWLTKSSFGSPQVEDFNTASNMIAAAIRSNQ